MRRIPIEYVRSGDILAQSLYTDIGGLLLREGFVLNDDIIKKLKRYGYLSIGIRDKYSQDDIEEIIKPKIMNRIYYINDNLSKMVIDYSNDRAIDNKNMRRQVKSFQEILDEIINDIISNKNLLENLATISVYDDYTLNHSLNMMMLSVALARDMGLNMVEIRALAIGCVLHDIGKMFIPIEVIRKSDQLTEEEFELVKTHTKKGFQFLKDCMDISSPSRNISLYHHERIDGFGYPKGLEGDEIHIFAKIASVSDVFDALISDRPYRRAIAIHEAREYILAGDNQFDMDVIKSFSRSINPYPKDTLIYLSDGREGIVHELNQGFYTRPKVKIYGEKGKRVIPYEVDLMDYCNIVIDKVLHLFSFDQ